MKTTTALAMVVAAMTAAGSEVCTWQGEAMQAWARGAVRHITNVRFEKGIVKGTVNGLDPNIYVALPAALETRADHVLYMKAKCRKGGRAEIFWLRPQDKLASGQRKSTFGISSDGEWHEYRLLLDWFGKGVSVDRLRFDLPGSDEPYDFEIAEVRLVTEGETVDIDAKKTMGVAFSLQMPPGVHYCTIEWLREGGKIGFYYFSPATDGLKHDYWFNLAEARRTKTNEKLWSGHIVRCRVRQVKYGMDLPVENLRFVEKRPDTPSDVSIVTAQANDAIPRAGRPFPVEVLLRNYGTQLAKDITFSFVGLPKGVKPLDAKELIVADPLPGSEGQDSVLTKYRYYAKPLVHERHVVIRLSDLGEGTHRFWVKVHAAGQSDRSVQVVAKVQPSLGLAACDYPPEPKPVLTDPYKVGAIIFPGWLAHSWEPDWNRAPWRKPVLGWYDESKPETIDWQIKQLVENGISFVCVNWYWNRKLGRNYWMDVFAKAKYRKHLKWFLQWSNHNPVGAHSAEDQLKVTRHWIEHYFNDPQYMRIDGKPVVAIYCPQNMERDMKGKGGCKALTDIMRSEVVAAGFPGLYIIGMRGLDRDSREFLEPFESMGLDATTVYHYTASETPGSPLHSDGSHPYSWVASSSYDHWKRLAANSRLPIWPSLSTGRDDRIWNGEGASHFITGNNAADFGLICRSARQFSDETGRRHLLIAPLDEWSEGEIGYPNAEHGFGFFEQVRETFGRKPKEGWPVNVAPEDVGLECPQLDLYSAPYKWDF